MSLSEFSLIERYFTRKSNNPNIQLSIGDDCALLTLPAKQQLAITTDTMVENIHFFPDVKPRDLGHKLLAVNLSDLASMGAKPLAVTLAITLPNINETWLSEFAEGFLNLADYYQVDLIGGDTTQGALTLTVQALGLIPQGFALRRNNAQVGDIIYVSGNIGDAGLGLKIKQGYSCINNELALNRFHRPTPQIELGLALRGIANSCIDISDGLASDLGHIIQQSDVGANIQWEKIPLSSLVKDYVRQTQDEFMPLLAGDDYELCFTVPPEKTHLVPQSCTAIGTIIAERALYLTKNQQTHLFNKKGYEHFA